FDCHVLVEQMTYVLAELSTSKHEAVGKLVETTVIKIGNDAKNLLIHKHEDKDFAKLLQDHNLAAISEEFNSIARSIIIQRELKEEAKALDVAFERGLILSGPPGNGKTKLAKALAEILGCTENNGRLIALSGTAIFDMWVGSSEANVRKLFE